MNNKYLIMLILIKSIIIFKYTTTHGKHIQIPLGNIYGFEIS